MPHGKRDKQTGKAALVEERLKRALNLMKRYGMKQTEAARVSGLHPKTLRRVMASFEEQGLSPSARNVHLAQACLGKPEWLNSEEKKVLRVFLLALDTSNIVVSIIQVREAFLEIRRLMRQQPDFNQLPSVRMVYYMLKKMDLKVKIARDAPGGALRATKIQHKYLGPYFEKLGQIMDDEAIVPELIFNADEVSVRPASMKLRVVSSRETVRFDQSIDGHLTVLLTASAVGEMLPPGLIVKGEGPQDIPDTEAILEETDTASWGAVTSNGYMDQGVFGVFAHRFVQWVRERRNADARLAGCKALLVLDGHKSRFNISALVFLAINDIIVLCLPSHTTHVLQPLDSGINKSFKSLLHE